MRDRFVNVRLDVSEVYRLDKLRASTTLSRSAYMREATLNSVPKVIPEINREQWVELSRIGANLNQIAHEFNIGRYDIGLADIISESLGVLKDVRASLIGG